MKPVLSRQSVGKILAAALILSVSQVFSGCVSKSAAQAQARIAYLAGQRDALMRMQEQQRNPSVTFIGPLNNPVVPWSDGLTLSRAIVSAGYNAPANPKMIIIRRSGQEIQIDPKRLLAGEDFPVQSGDMVEIIP